jgi:hypothetical protein
VKMKENIAFDCKAVHVWMDMVADAMMVDGIRASAW